MHKRAFGRTGWRVSEIGFGAWAIGGSWGDVSEQDAEGALHEALDHGVNFLDTADVYGNGRSERLIARVLKARGKGDVIVATKAGRKIQPHVSAGYTPAALEQYIDASLRNMQLDSLDVLQLHCPTESTTVRKYSRHSKWVTAGKLKSYGVSVEKVEEAIKAPTTQSPVCRSSSTCFASVRPSASSIWQEEQRRHHRSRTAREWSAHRQTARDSQFAADDHRTFNRNGRPSMPARPSQGSL